MTTSIATMDSRDFLRESVKEYIKEYKNERVLKEKRLEEIRVDENINRILSEQSISLEDIRSNLSVDPFSGKKINMTAVTPPETAKFISKGLKTPKEKGAPAIIPRTKDDVDQMAANAAKGGKLAINALFGDPSGVISQCSDAYGMISTGAGSIIGWNLEFIVTPLLKAMIGFFKFTAKAGGAILKKIFKSGAEVAAPVTKKGAGAFKTAGKAAIRFGKYLGSAGKQILIAAVTLGLLAVASVGINLSGFFSDSENTGWVKNFGKENNAIATDGLQQVTDLKAIGKTAEDIKKKLNNFSIWDFCRFPNDKAQQCFFAGVTAGLSARMTLKLIASGFKYLVDLISGGGWKRVFGAARTKTEGAKEAIEKANLRELSDEISSLREQVADLQDNTSKALDRAYKEGLEDGARLGNEGWIINNAIDMFQPKQVVIDTISKNRDVFTEDVMQKLGKSKFTLGVWADDPKKGFRLAIDLADDANIDEKTLQRIQEVLDGASRKRTDAIHRSLQESSEQLHRNSDFVAAKGTAKAGARMADASMDGATAFRNTEILSVLKEETEVITRALQHSTNEMKAASKGVEEALKDLPDASKSALQDAFDKSANNNKLELEQFREFLGERGGLSEDIIKRFHESQSKVVANAQAVEKILEERIKNSKNILERLSIQSNTPGGAGNFQQHFAGAGQGDAAFFEQSQELIGDIGKQVQDASALAGDSKYLGELNERIAKMSGQYKKTYFGKDVTTFAPKALGTNLRTSKKVVMRRREIMKRIFKKSFGKDLAWESIKSGIDRSPTLKGKGEIPEQLLGPDGPIHKAFKDSNTVDEFMSAIKKATDDYEGAKGIFENKKGIKIMTESNIKELVKELFKENSGQGYSKYPYGSSARDQEEPKEDYIEEWKALSVEVIRDETRGTAIEIAKILVEDLELFEDVLDLAGQNQSIGTEILTKLKQIKEKA